MANTYTLISKVTAAGGETSVTFNSIPQIYTDLVVKTTVRDTNNSPWGNQFIYFNANTTNYTYQYFRGLGTDGATASYSAEPNAGFYMGFGGSGAQATTSVTGSTELYIPNYSVAINRQTVGFAVTENNSANNAQIAVTGDYGSSAVAITSLTVAASNSFVAGSTFYLYGIAKS